MRDATRNSSKNIEHFLETPESISPKERNRFELALRKTGYDLAYRKYLSKYTSNLDEFCILIDRDAGSHSSEDMNFICNIAKKKNTAVLLQIRVLSFGCCSIFPMFTRNIQISLT